MPEHEPHAMIPSSFGTTPIPSVPGLSSSQPTTASCHLEFDLAQYQIPVLVVSAVCFVVSLVYSFFGYRFFKAVLFMTGLIFGSILIYLICDKEKLLPPLGNAGIAIGAGVLFGLITMLVEYVGLFLTGFLTGLFLGIVTIMVLHVVSPPSTVWVTIGVLFVCGLVMALLTLNWSKLFVIFGTSLMGGALLITSIDYFIERFALIKWVWDVLNVRSDPTQIHICWYGWLLIGLWPTVVLMGSVIQWRITGAGLQYKDHIRSPRRKRRGDRRGSGQHLTEVHTYKDYHRSSSAAKATKQTVERQQDGQSSSTGGHSHANYLPKSFKQLYQARQKQGDVICQSHMESLERMKNQRLQNQTTLSSDNTHFTIVSEDTSTTVIQN